MLYTTFVRIYDDVFAKIAGTEQIYEFSSKEKATVKGFLKRNPDISENWLYDYLMFQFNRYADKDTMYGKGFIQINWVIGDKAETAWKNKTDGQMFYAQKLKVEKGITKETDWSVSLSDSWSMRERKRFFNTARGWLHCQEFGIKRSLNQYCLTCKFKNYCEEE